MEIPHEDQSSHYDNEKDKFAYLSMRDRIELGKRQVQQSQWGSKYVLNEDMSMKAKLASMARRIEEFELRNVHTEAQPQAMPTSFEYINHPNLATQPQPQPSMSTSSLEQAILKISKVMEDFVGGNAKMMKEKEEKREFWPLVLLPLSGHIWSTSSSPFYTYYMLFRSSGSQESNASNGVQIGVETKVMVIARKLDRAEREFRTPQSKVRKISHRAKHLLAHECHFAHLKPIFAPCETRCKNFAHHYSRCEIHFKVRKSQFKVHQFRTPQSKVRKISHRAKPPPGTRVPFRTPQAHFRTV
uniref:Uncharacterized protein n=1 Tax=Vitis vinifera TaxID=29760 RepID=A5BI40_VITVI|nr:hypothetical protein VITISV_016614 [Vitis vinifera]